MIPHDELGSPVFRNPDPGHVTRCHDGEGTVYSSHGHGVGNLAFISFNHHPAEGQRAFPE